MKYRITDALSGPKLTEYVNNLIKDGWKPLGGVSVTGEFHGTTVYVQAMVTDKMNLKVPVERKFAID